MGVSVGAVAVVLGVWWGSRGVSSWSGGGRGGRLWWSSCWYMGVMSSVVVAATGARRDSVHSHWGHGPSWGWGGIRPSGDTLEPKIWPKIKV